MNSPELADSALAIVAWDSGATGLIVRCNQDEAIEFIAQLAVGVPEIALMRDRKPSN